MSNAYHAAVPASPSVPNVSPLHPVAASRRAYQLPQPAPEAYHLPPEVLRSVLESVDNPVAIVCHDGQVLFQNSAAVMAAASQQIMADRPPASLWYQTGHNMHGCTLHVGQAEPATSKAVAGVCSTYWRLTPRQAQVLELVLDGHSNKAIATTLSCSTKTVELHVSAILSKTQCASRTSLVGTAWSQYVRRRSGTFQAIRVVPTP